MALAGLGTEVLCQAHLLNYLFTALLSDAVQGSSALELHFTVDAGAQTVDTGRKLQEGSGDSLQCQSAQELIPLHG